MKVYVINNNGNLLMPCKPSKARKLLRDGKAKAVKRTPLTIQLTWDCEENVQPIRLGIDKDSKTTGFCAVGNGEIQISGHIKHRTDVSKKMTARAANRSQRRSRLWYRAPRFLNRSSSNGSLAFKRIKGDPNTSVPKNCRLLEHQSTIVFSAIQ